MGNMTDRVRRERRRTVIKYSIFTFGVMLTFGGFAVLLFLQSSMNIDHGLGAASVTATYVTSVVLAVTVTPCIIRALGPKNGLLLSELTYFIFIVANFYPALYTLIPAGVIVGFGEAVMWPVMAMFNVYFAHQYAEHGSEEPTKYIVNFVGSFYLVFFISIFFGQLISYGVLYGGQSSTFNQTYNASTSSTPIVRDFSVCGSNDCQDPNITSQNIGTYVPTSQVLVYILIGVMACLVLLAMLIHGCFMKKIDSNLQEQTSKVKYKEDSRVKMATLPLIASTLKQALLFLIRPKQLLITPFSLYNGITLGFAMTELTRAFGSCILGVEKIGLCLAFSSGCAAVTSWVSCKVSSQTNRHVPMLIGFCVDFVKYMICLLWIPTESTVWVVYIIFVLDGITEGHWYPLLNDIYCKYFPGEEDIALSVWNIYALIGVAWQAGWSTSLCVDTKIYFQIALLCLAITCYGISQLVYYRTKPIENGPKELQTAVLG